MEDIQRQYQTGNAALTMQQGLDTQVVQVHSRAGAVWRADGKLGVHVGAIGF